MKQKNKNDGTNYVQPVPPIVDILTSSPSQPQKLKYKNRLRRRLAVVLTVSMPRRNAPSVTSM
jgi:hypothetical protein